MRSHTSIEPPTLFSIDDGMSDIQTTVKSYGEGSQDYTSDRLASTISSPTYSLSTPKNLTTEESVVVHHTRVSMSDRVRETLDAMRVPRREFQVRDKVYYGVSKDDLVYVKSRLASMRRVQSCASILAALCVIFNETTLLNVVSNFVEQVKKAGGKKNLGRAKASMGHGHRAMARAIAALQNYYVENPGEAESLTKFWNTNDNVPSGRKCSPTIVEVYSTYRQDQSVLINLEEQIKGFTNALPIGAHGMVMGPPSGLYESVMVTQSTSIPTDGTTLQRSTCSLASTQTRPSFIVKLAYGP